MGQIYSYIQLEDGFFDIIGFNNVPYGGKFHRIRVDPLFIPLPETLLYNSKFILNASILENNEDTDIEYPSKVLSTSKPKTMTLFITNPDYDATEGTYLFLPVQFLRTRYRAENIYKPSIYVQEYLGTNLQLASELVYLSNSSINDVSKTLREKILTIIKNMPKTYCLQIEPDVSGTCEQISGEEYIASLNKTPEPITPTPTIKLMEDTPMPPPITTMPITTMPITTMPITTMPITTMPITTMSITTMPITTMPITTMPITPITTMPITTVIPTQLIPTQLITHINQIQKPSEKVMEISNATIIFLVCVLILILYIIYTRVIKK
jgi:hypothetical protein